MRAAPRGPPAARPPSASASRRGRSHRAARCARPPAAAGIRAALPTAARRAARPRSARARALARRRHLGVLAHAHRRLAAQQRAARLREHQRAVAVVVDAHEAQHEQLPQQRPPSRRRHVAADAEHRQLLVPMPRDLLGRVAEQHVDDVRRRRTTGRCYRRPTTACARPRCRPRSRAARAVVAVAAGLGALLAEVREQRPAPALGDLAPAEQRVELGALAALVLLVGVRCRDELRELHDVLQPVHHPRVGGLAVAARAPRLLVVRLDALRQIQVRDEPYIRLVDAHAERDRRDDDQRVFHEEPPLVLGARFGRQARVIRQRAKPWSASHSAMLSVLSRDRQ